MTESISWPQARAAAYDAGSPLEATAAPLADAVGYTLARPLAALAALPAFDTAAMDGYAVAGEPPWAVVGRVLAGDAEPRALRPGEALEVATGAPVPDGAVAVLPYERATRHAGPRGDRVAGTLGGRPHIRRFGEECAAGTELLPVGAVLTPVGAGLAASTGHDRVWVHRRPRVASIVTGEEVVGTGLPPRGRVRDAVGPLLPGLVTWAGGVPLPTRHLGDDSRALGAAVTAARDAEGADVVVVCGASSAGPADHLRAALRSLGARVLVDGVACRPGHPQVLAAWGDGRVLVGLPGNPFAALVAALTLLVPLLAALSGRPAEPLPRARLCGRVAAHPRDTRLVATTVRDGDAFPVGHDSPALLWGAARADGLAVIPPGGGGSAAEVHDPVGGTVHSAIVEVLPLPR